LKTKILKRILIPILSVALIIGSISMAYAQPETAVITNTETIAVPVLNSATGIVMNADTGEILWSQDADTQYYPASITKVMTALLVMEKCPDLDAKVTYSKTATTNLESGATSIKLEEGDVLTVRESLYALMIKSANEVANGLAEHIGGSISGFADMMNARAKELGCTNTNFVNPNGLNNDKHLTTAHDMALITAAAFKYDELRKIDTTASYKLPATKAYPNGQTIKLINRLINPVYDKCYKYAIAAKTGYTKKAGNTLVSMAEKDGVRLVAVTMKNTAYLAHYDDHKALLKYGFDLMEQRSSETQPASSETQPASSEAELGFEIVPPLVQ